MKGKIYKLRIQEVINPKLLSGLITTFLNIIQEFCTVKLITLERKRYRNRGNR